MTRRVPPAAPPAEPTCAKCGRVTHKDRCSRAECEYRRIGTGWQPDFDPSLSPGHGGYIRTPTNKE